MWPCLFFIVVISFRPWAPRNVFIIKQHRVQHACFCFVLCFFVSFSYYVDYQRCLCTQMLKWFMAVYTFQPFPIFYIGIVYFYTSHCFEWFRIFSELCIDLLFLMMSKVLLKFQRICQLLIHVVADFRWCALKSNFSYNICMFIYVVIIHHMVATETTRSTHRERRGTIS